MTTPPDLDESGIILMFFIILMDNYHVNLPKLDVSINILLKKHHFLTENEVF